jgi:hypothetical protein
MQLQRDASGTVWLVPDNGEEVRLTDLSPAERPEVLDELVHDAKGAEAAANNAGKAAQLAYLLGG